MPRLFSSTGVKSAPSQTGDFACGPLLTDHCPKLASVPIQRRRQPFDGTPQPCCIRLGFFSGKAITKVLLLITAFSFPIQASVRTRTLPFSYQTPVSGSFDDTSIMTLPFDFALCAERSIIPARLCVDSHLLLVQLYPLDTSDALPARSYLSATSSLP